MRQKRAFGVKVGASPWISGERGVIAVAAFRPHDVIFEVLGPIVQKRTKWSFQVSPHEHIDPFEEHGPGFGYYLNHSCDPNAFVRIHSSPKKRLFMCARQKIHPGEEVRVDYASMEYELTVAGLPCKCGSNICRRELIGFKDLPDADRERYVAEGIVPKHLLDQFTSAVTP